MMVDPEKIPEWKMDYFGSKVMKCAMRFFADPKNKQAFEAWEAARKKETAPDSCNIRRD